MSAAATRLGVGILTYGDSGTHLPLLETLWAQGLAPAEVVVVHNPASPGEADPPVAPGVELVRTPRNLGYAGGMNVAIEQLL
ncbi:MAG: glycosyltransferase family 2 protein, partial [Solirubrobacterales bacterium]